MVKFISRTCLLELSQQIFYDLFFEICIEHFFGSDQRKHLTYAINIAQDGFTFMARQIHADIRQIRNPVSSSQ